MVRRALYSRLRYPTSMETVITLCFLLTHLTNMEGIIGSIDVKCWPCMFKAFVVEILFALDGGSDIFTNNDWLSPQAADDCSDD